MKIKKWLLLAVIMLILSACTGTNEDQIVPKESEQTSQVKELVPVEEKQEKVVEKPLVEEKPKILYELNPANWTLQPIGDADSKVVLLTIDDAPDKFAVEMAITLKKLNVPAIFFVNGHFLTTNEAKHRLKAIHDLGFAIGNHTQTHANLRESSEEQQQQEILQVNDTVEAILGERPKFFRAPFGVNTNFSKSLVQNEKMLLMNWTYGYDWEKEYMNATSLQDIMVNTQYLTNGANLLMHDRKWTLEALPGIVEGLRAKGYGFIDPQTIRGIE